MPGYSVSPDLLHKTAEGINNTIGELKAVGMDETADAGRGFSQLELRGMQVGHQGLQEAFQQFCDRWSWGVRTLVQDGNHIAQQLHLAAGSYHDMEQYASGALKDVVSDVMGNPHLTDDQVEKESWGQVGADNPINQALHPDFSAQSWEKTGHDAAQTWKGEARDVAEGQFGINKHLADAVGQGRQFTDAENKVFGPPPGQQGQ
jgi:hypothetical protein